MTSGLGCGRGGFKLDLLLRELWVEEPEKVGRVRHYSLVNSVEHYSFMADQFATASSPGASEAALSCRLGPYRTAGGLRLVNPAGATGRGLGPAHIES